MAVFFVFALITYMYPAKIAFIYLLLVHVIKKNPIAEPLDLPEPFARFSYAYRCQIGIYRVAHDQEIRAHGPQPVP